MKHVNRLAVIAVLLAGGLLPPSGADAAATAGHGTAAPASTRLWIARYHDSGISGASGVVMSPDGSLVYVTGAADDPGTRPQAPRRAVTIAYNAATGAKVWQQTFSSPVKDGFTSGDAIALSPDGSTVFITGEGSPIKSEIEYSTIAYNAATGSELWQEFFSLPGNQVVRAIAVSPDSSTVFVTGDDTTVAYNAATGARLWGVTFSADYFVALAISPDGSTLYTVGDFIDGSSSTEYLTVALDAATGAIKWVKRSGLKDAAGNALSVAVSPNGTAVYVTGAYYTVAYAAATGAILWRAWTKIVGLEIVASPDGSTVFMTGTAKVRHMSEVITAFNAATGAKVWVRTYAPPGTEINRPVADAVTADGSRLFVAADSDLPGHHMIEIWTAYDAETGVALSSGRFSGAKGDAGASGIAITPAGTEVVVSGGYDLDYQTLAYQPGA